MKRYFLLLIFVITGSFLMQGFQCASPEMTTGKVALQGGDWDKAEASFEKELAKNPQNAEAWLKLAETRYDKRPTQNIKGAAEALVQFRKFTVTDKKLLDEATIYENKIWTGAFNEAISKYNEYTSSSDTKLVNASINAINNGLILRPEMASFYNILGSDYEALKDTAKAIEAFSKYSQLLQKEIDLASDKGLYLNMKRDDAIRALGKPITKGYKFDVDSMYTDIFNVDGKEVFIFSSEKEKIFTVNGWAVDLPKNWPEFEREQPSQIFTIPFVELAQMYFEKKDYSKALDNVKKLLLLEPGNVDANAFLVGIYEAQGKKDEAVKYIGELVKKDPNNPLYKAQYGDILLKTGKYDEAISQYESALKLPIEQNSLRTDILRNMAAAYKNKAVIVQQEEKEKAEKDPKYNINNEAYFPMLRNSAKYFEETRPSITKPDVLFVVLGELANIYEVLGDNSKLTAIMSELEGLESSISENKKSEYYYKLLPIYDRLKKSDKLEALQKKIDALPK